MISTIYKKTLAVLGKKPMRFIGISILGTILSGLAWVLFGLIPGIALALCMLLTVGQYIVYLQGYRGEGVEVDYLFAAFKNADIAKRTIAGLAWRALWLFLWGLIPVVGIVFAVIKSYEYSLVPYILYNEPEVSPTEALKLSMKRTEGYKGKMFLSEGLIPYAIVTVVMLILALLGMIPFAGLIFLGILAIAAIVVAVLMPFFQGLVHAAYYEEIMANLQETPAHDAPAEGNNTPEA